MAKVLVTRHVYPQAVELLRSQVEVDYHDSAEGLSVAELQQRGADCDAVVCQLTDPITAEVMTAWPQVKVVANVAVGYDNIDVAAATAAGMQVTNTPGVLTESTADLAFGLILAVMRRIPESERFLRAGQWGEWAVDLLCGRDVHGATLGILGMGRIGQAVARRAQGFDMRVVFCGGRDPDGVGEPMSMSALLQQSDVVSVHVPLNSATRHLIGETELRQMQPTAALVNTARGPIVDEAALVEALRQGVIAGCGLDVFEDEPRVHPGLLALDNAVLLPHIGSASVQTRTRMCTMAAENVLAVLAGEEPPGLVRP